MINIEEFASFCKRKGFVFPHAEIYGGLAGVWDYGPLGVEIKNKIKQSWWKEFVQNREDVVGIDGSIINHQKIWKASGHVDKFTDPITECEKCHERYRADHLVEEKLKIASDGMSMKELEDKITSAKIKCKKCGNTLSGVKAAPQMLRTFFGSTENEDSLVYLRPETAQIIFTNFKNVVSTSRLKPPFGIAQIGKAFRNEIRPQNFIYRVRELEQMEIEYFAMPNEKKCALLKEVSSIKIRVRTRDDQEKNLEGKDFTINECVKNKIMAGEWQAYWLGKALHYYTNILGIKIKNLRLRQHVKTELSHYSSDTWDIEYNFPFGWKELHGNANRGTYDLDQHSKHSGKKLDYEGTSLKVVSEPSFGVDRAFLAMLYDSYEQEKERIVLHLNKKMAPVQIGVFPLVNKDGLQEKSREIFEKLRDDFAAFYDESGSIGRRYRRQDEIGTPYCITIDHDTLKDESVTVRERDSMKQERVKINDLNSYFEIRFK